MATFETLHVAADGPVGTLTLDNPDKLNPLSVSSLEELVGAASWFDSQPDVKVVVVSGAGRAFTAGADLAGFSDDGPGRDGADTGRKMAEAITGMRAVTIAAVHGHCIGGGIVLVAACDIRIAADDVRFSIPEVDLGIPLAWGGIPRLVREIGPAATRDLVLSCRPFGAEEAMGLGFVTRVVPAAELAIAAEALAQELSEKSTYTLRATLAAVDAAAEELVSTSNAWNDADAMMAAFHDPESRATGRRYLEARGR